MLCMIGLCLSAAAWAADDAAIRKKAEACFACHGVNGASTNAQYPSLAGQTSRYLYLQLKDFKEGRRSDPQMSPMAAPLTREDMMDLLQFFAAQPHAYQRRRQHDQRGASAVGPGHRQSRQLHHQPELTTRTCSLSGWRGRV